MFRIGSKREHSVTPCASPLDSVSWGHSQSDDPFADTTGRMEAEIKKILGVSAQLAHIALDRLIAERIIKMAENQQTHRQDLERTVVHGNVESERRGQWMGLTISVIVLAAGVYLAAIGRQAAGGAIAIADLATLAGVFVYGKQVQRQELDKKKEALKK
jgi:hypothetical protein